MTQSAARKGRRLPEEILQDGEVSMAHTDLALAIEDGNSTKITQCVVYLTEALAGLRQDFPEDWSLLMGDSRTPKVAAILHCQTLS